MQNNNPTLREDVRSYALELLCELITDDDFLVALKRVTDVAVKGSAIGYMHDERAHIEYERRESKRALIDVIHRGGFDR